MLIVENLKDLPSHLQYPVMTIGVFDGIHRGHQAILRRVVDRARETAGTATLLSFHPHPRRIISPALAPPLLQTLCQRQDALRTYGLDLLILLPFTRKLSLYSPRKFAQEILFSNGIREIHVGGNFRFGHHRAGDFQTLHTLGHDFGVQVFEVDPVRFRDLPVSSTRIRGYLEQGRIELANRFLARPYRIVGTVVKGAGVGSHLGYATANLVSDNELAPGTGVYAGRAYLRGTAYSAVTNIGYRPTVQEQRERKPVVEVHLLDFSEELYGEQLEVEFCLRLRGEKKFISIESLKKQIAKDVRLTREYVARGTLLTKE